MSFSETSHFSHASSTESLPSKGKLSESSKNILLICGGQSPEHQISLISAEYIAQNIDETYNVFAVVINQQGQWLNVDPLDIRGSAEHQKAAPVFAFLRRKGDHVVFETTEGHCAPIDIVFPVLHGPLGEDGTVQGMLQFLGVPFVGCDMRSSLMGMDKRLTKEFLSLHGIPVTPFVVLYDHQELPSFSELCAKLESETLFIKPSNSGSSIGIFHVQNAQEYAQNIRNAFEYDRIVLVEKRVQGHEVECAVLGDTTSPQASELGEIRVENDFYSYEAKYLGTRKVDIIVPAAIPPDLTLRTKALACEIFQLLGCSGMARVDFLIENDQIFLNEVNTIPGFTPISLYPQLWAREGVSGKDLIQRLINIGFMQFARQQKLVQRFAQKVSS